MQFRPFLGVKPKLPPSDLWILVGPRGSATPLPLIISTHVVDHPVCDVAGGVRLLECGDATWQGLMTSTTVFVSFHASGTLNVIAGC